MRAETLERKARWLMELREGRIEKLPADDATFDCAISNGVINLSPEKERATKLAPSVRASSTGSIGWKTFASPRFDFVPTSALAEYIQHWFAAREQQDA